jgi:adenylate kinase
VEQPDLFFCSLEEFLIGESKEITMTSATAAVRPKIYVLIGCPGSGKGTVGEALKTEGYEPISIGEFARDEVKLKTPFGLKYKDDILGHNPNPPPEMHQEIQALVMKKVEDIMARSKGAILDGFPKTKEQCELLDSFVKERKVENDIVIVRLNVDKQKAVDRISHRQICENCSKIYHLIFSPPKKANTCDQCQTTLGERIDKGAKSPEVRIDEYAVKIQPVLNYYKNSPHFHSLDGNLPREEVLKTFMDLHRQMHEKV